MLVAEDDPGTRRAIVRALLSLEPSLQIEECGDGRCAEERLDEGFDCVFLDYQLPGQDGLAVLREGRRSSRRTAFVMLTGQGDESLAVDAMHAGAADYLPKSKLSPERLAESLRHARRVIEAEAQTAEALHRLKANEQRLNRIVEAIADGVLINDANGVYTFANAAAERILALPASRIVGRSYHDPPWARTRLDNTPLPMNDHPLVRVMRTGRPTTGIEFVVIREDGRRLVAAVSASPLVDPSGRLDGMVTTFRDITETKAAEAALRHSEEAVRESEARYRSLFEDSPVALWEEDFSHLKAHLDQLVDSGVTDIAMHLRAHPGELSRCLSMVRLLDVNRATMDLYEAHDRDELLQNLERVVGERAGEQLAQSIAAVAGNRVRFQTEIPQRTLRGRLRHVTMTWSVAPGHERTYAKVLVSIVDITQRKQAEEALRHSEEALRESNARVAALVAAAPLGIVAMDNAGCVHTWNPAMERIFGWREQEVLGKPLPIVPPEFEEQSAAMRARVLRGKTFTGMELRRKRKDGSMVEVSLSTATIRDASGGIVGVLATIEDITQAKRLKEQLLQAHRMETVGRLAGGVAHDFNNLLAVISGYTEALMRRVEDGPLLPYVQEIQKAADRGASVTRQLLAFSRRTGNQTHVIDLNQLVAGIYQMLRHMISGKIGIDVREQAQHVHVRVDPRQMEQVLTNLALNARDAMPAGGALTITIGRESIDSEAARALDLPSGEYATLDVHDTGTGIDEEVRQRIFEPFFTTKEGRGTGLGLSIVYEIVRQSGGRISVESQPGHGALFRIVLPLAEENDGDGKEPC